MFLCSFVVCSIFGVLNPASRQDVHVVPERLVAEAQIWGANDARNGYAFLPVTIHGHAATVVINLNDERDLSLSTAALAKFGITVQDTATQWDALIIGHDVQRDIPLHVIKKSLWSVSGPGSLPPVVGIVGVHFLTRYDVLYDFPHRLVRLYAIPHGKQATKEWLPPGIKAADCGRLIPIPPGAATFTGMEVRIDGHPVTGVIEMAAYGDETDGDEKMNEGALKALALPPESARLTPIPGRSPFEYNGRTVEDQVNDVHITVGSHMFWEGRVKIFPILDVEGGLPQDTPVMLMNLVTIRQMVLFNAISSGRVCLSDP